MKKKMIKMINNERVNAKLTSQKACDADSYDVCTYQDEAACAVNSYDKCGKDFALCYSNSYDLCNGTDLDACINGTHDID